MSTVLVCQHVAFEILGTLSPLLKSYGVRIKYVNFARHPDASPTLDGYRGLDRAAPTPEGSHDLLLLMIGPRWTRSPTRRPDRIRLRATEPERRNAARSQSERFHPRQPPRSE